MGSESPDYLGIIPIKRIVADVRACIKQNISVAGLALALTIPDVLGQECYPNMTHNDGSRRVSAQYIRWYNAYVAHQFGQEDSWFDGEMCYELRCSLLHSGRADIEYRHHDGTPLRYEYIFELVDDSRQFHEEIPHPEKPAIQICRVHLNADLLAAALCEGAEKWLRE